MERIELAAIRLPDGTVMTGRRHANLISEAAEKGLGYIRQDMQGFVTSDGRYVDRREAAEIAHAAGQTHTKRSWLDSYEVIP